MAEPIRILHILGILLILLLIFLKPQSLVFRRHHRRHPGNLEYHRCRHQSHLCDLWEIS